MKNGEASRDVVSTGTVDLKPTIKKGRPLEAIGLLSSSPSSTQSKLPIFFHSANLDATSGADLTREAAKARCHCRCGQASGSVISEGTADLKHNNQNGSKGIIDSLRQCDGLYADLSG